MRKFLLLLVVLLIGVQFCAQATVIEHRLTNGMRVWLNVDRTLPRVFGAVIVRAGAIDSPGTGIAHYFEHMAFKGTDKIGTIDYEKEKVYLDSIENYYNQLTHIDSKKEITRIQKQINHLSIEAAKYAIPNEFERLLQTYGGAGINAGTSYDYTVYFNAFSPQYINQWCALNSERIISPVFRLFQSELETVYEEKNMLSNGVFGDIMNRALDKYMSPSYYGIPIIGYTANLKKPDMSAMRQYYNKFYNAANIDLLISGDIDSVAVVAELEKSFGRIVKGERVERNYPRARIMNGREKSDLKIPIPIVRGRVFGWRGVTECDSDKIALDVALALLSNSNQTGYLDSLSISGKCLGAIVLSIPFRYEGLLVGAIIPKMFGGTLDGVEKLFFEQIERLKQGDINEELMESVKLTTKRGYELLIEDQGTRVSQMISLLGNEKSWDGFIGDVQRIDSISNEDIVKVVNKYFSENYLCLTKKNGTYPKEKMIKPAYEPITPYNQGAKSVFAQELEKMQSSDRLPTFLNLTQDIQSSEIVDGVKVYATENKENDIFSLNYKFSLGSTEMPMLKQLDGYMAYVGADSLSRIDYMSQLQRLGADVSITCSEKDFAIRIVGYDHNFDATLKLVSRYFNNLGVDEKAAKNSKEENELIKSGFSRINDIVAHALLKYVQYGEKSSYINRLSNKEMKKLKATDLVAAFDTLRSKEFYITYYGKLPIDTLKSKLTEFYDFNSAKIQSHTYDQPEYRSYFSPTIYYIREPKSSQAIIYSYNHLDSIDSNSKMLQAKLINSYIGGNMNSVLFQEVREFRSLAYNVQSALSHIDPKDYGRAIAFTTRLSTQNDKALEAITLLDSLITNMTFDSLRLSLAKREIVNDVYQSYPKQRDKCEHVVQLLKNGHSIDPIQFEYNNVNSVDTETLNRFYKRHFQAKPTVYIVVGDISKQQLAFMKSIGAVITLSKDDVMKDW